MFLRKVYSGMLAHFLLLDELYVGDRAEGVSGCLFVADRFLRIHVRDAGSPHIGVLIAPVFGKLGSRRIDKGDT